MMECSTRARTRRGGAASTVRQAGASLGIAAIRNAEGNRRYGIVQGIGQGAGPGASGKAPNQGGRGAGTSRAWGGGGGGAGGGGPGGATRQRVGFPFRASRSNPVLGVVWAMLLRL